MCLKKKKTLKTLKGRSIKLVIDIDILARAPRQLRDGAHVAALSFQSVIKSFMTALLSFPPAPEASGQHMLSTGIVHLLRVANQEAEAPRQSRWCCPWCIDSPRFEHERIVLCLLVSSDLHET